MVRLSVTTRVDSRDATALAPYYGLWQDENFQTAWVNSLRADLQVFKDIMWEADFENLSSNEAKTWSDVLGLPIPRSDEELARAMRALRTVVKYCEWKLDVTKGAAERYSELQKLALEEEKASGR